MEKKKLACYNCKYMHKHAVVDKQYVRNFCEINVLSKSFPDTTYCEFHERRYPEYIDEWKNKLEEK